MKRGILAALIFSVLLAGGMPHTTAQAANTTVLTDSASRSALSDNRPTGGRVQGKAIEIDESIVAHESSDSIKAGSTKYILRFSAGDRLYGYRDLSNHPKAEAKKTLYQSILKAAYQFEQSGKDAPKVDAEGMYGGNYNYFASIRYVSFGLNRNDVYEVYKLFQMDHPSCYWMDTNVSMLCNSTSCFLCVSDTYRTAESRAKADSMIAKKLTEYARLTRGMKTKYNIERAVHDKICEDITYNYSDLSGIYSQSIMGVMDSSKNTTVCAGYAKAYMLILNTLGLEALYVEGYGDGGGHAWNLIQLDNGKWYWNDITWDDSTSSTRYFNCPNKYFTKEHYANNAQFTSYDHAYDLPTASNSVGYAYRAAASKVFTYNGHTYAYYEHTADWVNAESACESLGGTLAVINDEAEQKAIYKQLSGKEFWLGAQHPAGGEWSWVTGEPWRYTNWSNPPGLISTTETSYALDCWDNEWESYTKQLMNIGILCEWNTQQSSVPAIPIGYCADYYRYGIRNLSKATVSAPEAQTYLGQSIGPSCNVKYGSTTLMEGTDYIVTFQNNVDVGTGTMVLYGRGAYYGTKKQTFRIKPRSVAANNLTLKAMRAYTYTGNAVKPDVVLQMYEWRLTKGTDYTLSYSKNVNCGTAVVKVTGKGNYTGTRTQKFKIIPASMKNVTVAKVYEQKYTGKAIKPALTIQFNGKTLKAGTDYTVTYENNVKVGQSVMTIKGKGNFSGTIHRGFYIVKSPATAVKLDCTRLTLKAGASLMLKATVAPSNATTKTVTWKSSKASVATVSGGTVYAKKKGTAVITAIAASGKQTSCTVTVP